MIKVEYKAGQVPPSNENKAIANIIPVDQSKESLDVEFELYEPIIVVSNSFEVHGVTSSIGGLICYTDFYQKLGLNRQSAHKVINRLVNGKHYVTISIAELQTKYPCVYESWTHLKKVSLFYLLTEEGFSRFVIEVELGKIRTPHVVENLLRIRDEMAQVYVQYRRGELIQNIYPQIHQGYVPISPVIEDHFEQARIICKNCDRDIGAVQAAMMAQASRVLKSMGHDGDLTHVNQFLAPVKEDYFYAYLTATMIGEKVGLSNRTINRLLEEWGYHFHTYIEKKEKKEIRWEPTELGKPHGGWHLDAYGKDNASLHNKSTWFWKESILKVFEEKLGINLPPDQTTFQVFGNPSAGVTGGVS